MNLSIVLGCKCYFAVFVIAYQNAMLLQIGLKFKCLYL